MKTTKEAIDRFLAPKKLVIAGVSRDPKKFGNIIYKEMKDRGYEVYAVNPNTDEVNGDKCYRSLDGLPEGVKHLLVVTKKPQTATIVQEALARGFDHFWIQQMSETPEAISLLEGKPVTVVTKECMLMWLDPVKSVHRFHKCMRRLFGRLPK
jgi:predicted CoA-binding protein